MCDHPDLENCADRWEDRERELRRQAQHDLDWEPAPTGPAYYGDVEEDLDEQFYRPDWNGLTREEMQVLLEEAEEWDAIEWLDEDYLD